MTARNGYILARPRLPFVTQVEPSLVIYAWGAHWLRSHRPIAIPTFVNLQKLHKPNSLSAFPVPEVRKIDAARGGN